MGLSSWLIGATGRRRGLGLRGKGRCRGLTPREALWAQPNVRRLEPRRVLNASVTNLLVPSTAVEGETVVVAAEGTGDGSLRFDWSVSQDSQQVAEGTGQSFEFQAPDDGIYTVDLQLTDESLTTDLAAANLVVSNVAPSLESTSFIPPGDDGVAMLSGTIDDPGVHDAITLQVDWGDAELGGSIETIELAAGERQFSLDHVYPTDDSGAVPGGPIDVSLVLLDGDAAPTEPVSVSSNLLDGSELPGDTLLGVQSASVSVDDDGGNLSGGSAGEEDPFTPNTLILELPEMVNESESVFLTVFFANADQFDTHTVTVDWGDMTEPTNTPLAPGARDVTIQHVYRDDNPSGTVEDINTVRVTVTDDEGNPVSAEETILVKNVAPADLAIQLADMVEEGDNVDLSLQFADPGLLDVHTVTIDWGDGTTQTVETLPTGDREGDFSHVYNTGGASMVTYEVSVTVADDDLGSITAADSIIVKNTAPTALVTRLTNMIDEGDSATLIVEFADESALDVHTVTVQWGDGGETVRTLSPGARDVTINYIYLDDDDEPPMTPQDTFEVRVTVTDDNGNFVSGTDSIVVKNVAPSALVTELTTMVSEGENARLVVRFADEGRIDRHTIVVDWGDGTETERILSPGARDVTIDHLYRDDNPSGTLEDINDVSVTVTDDDGGSVTGFDSILVKNVDPVLSAMLPSTALEGEEVLLEGGFTDVGVDDTHKVTIDWGDDSEPDELNFEAGDMLFNATHTFLADGPYTVEVTLEDDDGGTDTFTASILIDVDGPQDLVLALPDMITEDETAELIVTFRDSAVSEMHTFTIEWGDLSTPTMMDLPFILNGTTNTRTFTHRYLDDNPTGTPEDTYTVTVTITDVEGDSVMGTTSILVKNDVPHDLVINLTGPVDENGMPLPAGGVPGGVGPAAVVAGGTTSGNGSIAGYKYEDVNGNGIRDVGIVQADRPDVVFVIDVSGSTDNLFGGDPVGDQNGDGVANTILDAEIAAFVALNQQLVDLGVGDTARVGIVAFESGSAIVDMDPLAGGVQLTTTSLADMDGNGVRDVDQALQALSSGSLTNFEAGLQDAIAILDGAGIADGGANVIFLSDGVPTAGGNFSDEVTEIRDGRGQNLRAFGVGPGSSLSDLQTIDPLAQQFSNTNELLSVFSGIDGGGMGGGFSEPGIAGVRVYVDLNNNAMFDTGEPSAITMADDPATTEDETGSYVIENLPPGTYTVLEVMPDGFIQTAPDGDGAYHVTLGEGEQRTGLNFGNQQGLMIFEHQLARLNFHFEDAGTQDVHTVTIDWGDGSEPMEKTLAVLDREEMFVHRYLDDNPRDTASDPYTVRVTVMDDDGGEVTTTRKIVVKNVAPTEPQVELTPMINEDGTAQLIVTFVDVGTRDIHTITVDWKDGSTPMERTLAVGEREATFFHQYLDDDPSHTMEDPYEVVVKVADDDLGSNNGTKTVVVVNLNPELTLSTLVQSSDGATVQLAGTFADVGTRDTHTGTIDWGDGTVVPLTVDQIAGAVVGSHTYSDIRVFTVNVTLVDDDGGIDTETFTVDVGNPGRMGGQNGNTDEGDDFRYDLVGGGGGLDRGAGEEALLTAPQNGSVEISFLVPDLRAVQAELAADSDLILVLQVIEPDGSFGEAYKIDKKVLDDIWVFFSKLPNNEYRMYVMRQEHFDSQNVDEWRFVIGATVRQGRMVDPSDESDGAQEKPPTRGQLRENFPQDEQPAPDGVLNDVRPVGVGEEHPLQTRLDRAIWFDQSEWREDRLSQRAPAPIAGQTGDVDGALPADFWNQLGDATGEQSAGPGIWGAAQLAVAVGLTASASSGTWSERVNHVLSRAGEPAWRRLGRAGRHTRRVFRRIRPSIDERNRLE